MSPVLPGLRLNIPKTEKMRQFGTIVKETCFKYLIFSFDAKIDKKKKEHSKIRPVARICQGAALEQIS